MTATEMAYEFDLGYDFITNFEAPGVEPKEKSTYLTKAQEELVLDVYKGNAFVEENKRILDILKGYSTILAAAMADGPYTNSRWVTLPSTAFAVINERAVLTPTASHFYYGKTFSNVRVKPVDDDYYHLNINNPYKQPSIDKIWRMDYGDSGTQKLLYILPENMTLTSITVHFYAKPAPIIVKDSGYIAGDGSIDGVALTGYTAADLSCVLNKIVHREIVDRAVRHAYADLKDEKGFQLSTLQQRQ